MNDSPDRNIAARLDSSFCTKAFKFSRVAFLGLVFFIS